MTTLTIELDENELSRAETLAAANGTTLAEMVHRFVRVLAQPQLNLNELPPVTRSLAGVAPPMTDEEIENTIYEELVKKHGAA